MQAPERFDEAFRQWAERPVTSGTEAAATLFTRRERRSGRLPLSPAWATLVAAALVIASATTWVIGTGGPGPRIESIDSRLAAPSDDSDIVVVWLDDQTPVHVFLTEASARGAK
ncbi:MAG: hypothetical protein ACM3NQ_16930 [Bacteroidales bacterium]